MPQILQQDPRLEVLVVDDNSPDGTGQLADELAAAEPRIHVLHRPGKAGLGKAYLAGFRWALEQGYDLIFEMDADFCHDPKFLPDFLRAVEHADLVIGSRYKSGVNVINWPISRLLLSRRRQRVRPLDHRAAAQRLDRRIQVLPPAGARGDRSRRVRSNGYSFQIEMSFRAWKKGFRLVEIPIVFTDRVEGQSKMNKRIVREAIWMVWWLRLQSLVGRL